MEVYLPKPKIEVPKLYSPPILVNIARSYMQADTSAHT